MRTRTLLSTFFAMAVVSSLLLVPAPSSCFAGNEDCIYCKGTGKVEVDCPTCRGTGLGKEICPVCKGRDLTKQRCEHCRGKDLTREKCPHCRGKDLTKEKCPKCRGKGKIGEKDCWDCKGTGHKLACPYCKGTGKQEQCWYCKGTGKHPPCDACSGTGRKNKCPDCKGTGKTVVECTACRIARLTASKEDVPLYAAALGDIVVAVSAGKTYLVNRSDKPIIVEPITLSGRDKDGKDVFTQEMKLEDACQAQAVREVENTLKSLEGIKDLLVKQGDKSTGMKRYEQATDNLQEFLKKGKL